MTVSDASAQLVPWRTLAGISASSWDDGTGSAAGFNGPGGIAVDGSGNIYVADTYNCAIRRVTAAGVVITVAGDGFECGSADGALSDARFNAPGGIAVDNAGNFYIADSFNNTIRKMTPGGVVTTLAGLAGTRGWVDGAGTAARFGSPRGIAVDSVGNVYVADTFNYAIRKITPAGVVTTVAGSGGPGAADGIGTAAQFRAPNGIATDNAGNVFVADTNNHAIRKVVLATGQVTTLAGTLVTSGAADGSGPAARFNGPQGLTIDGAGTLYVADTNNHTIRQVTSAGVVTTLVGQSGLVGDVDGTGTAARFNAPWGISINAAGTLYVSDFGNQLIRRIAPGGVVTTLAGFMGSFGTADGFARSARFSGPNGVAVDSNGTVYVADRFNNTIRRVTAVGTVTTLAGLARSFGSGDGTGSAARFGAPRGVAVDSSGNVFVADTNNHTIRMVTSGGVVTTFAGSAGSPGAIDGTGSVARFGNPNSIAVDNTGTLYVADTNNHTIRTITPAGLVTTLAGLALNSGNTDGSGSLARFNFPRGIAVDGSGNVYVADTNNHTIRKITPGGAVTTLAGTAGASGNMDATGSAARFSNPNGVAVDADGNVYVADTNNHTIRKITPAGVVTTIGGISGLLGANDGVDFTRFNLPSGIAADAQGFLYVADLRNNTIRTSAPIRTYAGDFDGDAKADVVVFRPSDGTWYILNSSTGYSTYTAVAWGVSSDVQVPADYDGDGKIDIAIFRPSTGEWWIRFSSTGYSTIASYTWGISGDIPVPLDVDEDRTADLIIYRPSTGEWWALLSSTGFTGSGSAQWGGSGDIPVLGEYDGDGEADPAVYRPSTGEWWVLTDFTTPTNFTYFVRTWGIGGDKPVPADYDGDGRTDIAVYRPSTGEWFVLTSASNFTSYFTRTWGIGTDIPVPADYDGDGRADLAIYRNGEWYVLTSGSNYTTYVNHNWGVSTDVPVLKR